jgi:hypothetical protein
MLGSMLDVIPKAGERKFVSGELYGMRAYIELN